MVLRYGLAQTRYPSGLFTRRLLYAFVALLWRGEGRDMKGNWGWHLQAQEIKAGSFPARYAYSGLTVMLLLVPFSVSYTIDISGVSEDRRTPRDARFQAPSRCEPAAGSPSQHPRLRVKEQPAPAGQARRGLGHVHSPCRRPPSDLTARFRTNTSTTRRVANIRASVVHGANLPTVPSGQRPSSHLAYRARR